ncbi:MAG TPA: cupredoxin family copper-binding protein [Mycobacterium sp.]|nr:cupredoxin family copper-binding protein [Mycobacterium sp.]
MLRHFDIPLGAAAVAATALLVSGCSGSSPSQTAHPSINFGPQASTTPGLVGQGTAAAPAATAATPSSTAAPGAPQSGNAVFIVNFKFDPATLTVPVGTTVTWTNQDEEPHTVVAKDGSFHSPGLDTHATYSFTFNNPGTYDYGCSIHPFMTGTVVVTK